MRELNLAKLRQEPLNSGIIAGFSTLCAIAFVNLAGNLFSSTSGISGIFLLTLALVSSICIGAVAYLRSRKALDRSQSELKMAKSLADGDFSNAIWHLENGHTEMSAALTSIADRQLAIERNNGQLIQEAKTTEVQLISALDCVTQELAVFDKGGMLVCANSAYLSRCNMIGAVVSLGMTRTEIWAELAKAPRANLPVNERQSWLKIQDEMRHEAMLNKNPVRFMRFNNEPAQMSIHEAKDGHQVEIIENTASFLNLEARAL
ncbi:MAG: hypothetical protein ACRCU5_06540, partial [Rhizobiaceae bacterium]